MTEDNTTAPDERAPLLPAQRQPTAVETAGNEPNISIIWAVLPTLLLGVFIAQADSSIVLATSQKISSEFSALSNASWLITTYSLAQCACQPLYGKSSDIFGRKPALAFAYAVFAVGSIICGIGSEYWHVLAGRAISGIGGAGMVGLVAVIIADVLPVRQVAVWRSYVNVIATLGRSCGGPTGGWLVDNVGWRWCFLGQAPAASVALLLILWKLPANMKPADDDQKTPSFRQNLSRVDFAGFFTLSSALITAFVALDLAGKFYSWTYICPLAITSLSLFILFYWIETKYANEPIMPMQLLAQRDVVTSYLLVALQTAAQFVVTYTIPIYFQIAAGMTVAKAGSRIVFIVLGNTGGGLITGYLIGRTGRYKRIMITATLLGNICYALILIRWNGRSGLADTWYVVLGGIGMGSTQNTSFVHLAASLDAKDIGIAGTTWFLTQNIGMLVSANIFNVVHNLMLVNLLQRSLDGVPQKEDIIEGASSSVEYIYSLPPSLRKIVTKAFVNSLVPTNALSLLYGMGALLVGLLIRERRLDKE